MTVDRLSGSAVPRQGAGDVAMDGLFTGTLCAPAVTLWEHTD
jgi:hypothetical protein